MTLWCIDTLLSGNSVNNAHFWQQLGKHVPTAMNMHATIELLLETECLLCGPCRDVITRTVGAMTSVVEY
jgi:hypothetical protein